MADVRYGLCVDAIGFHLDGEADALNWLLGRIQHRTDIFGTGGA